jgi:uncharacterized protein (DUF697 family)
MEAKRMLESTTVWGALMTFAAAVPPIAKAFGLDIAPEDATQFVAALQGIFGGVGSLLAIYGRFKAGKPLTVG